MGLCLIVNANIPNGDPCTNGVPSEHEHSESFDAVVLRCAHTGTSGIQMEGPPTDSGPWDM
jgi:hypothetical protein